MGIHIEMHKIHEDPVWVFYRIEDSHSIPSYQDEGSDKGKNGYAFGYCKFNKNLGEFSFIKEKSHSYFQDMKVYSITKVRIKLLIIHRDHATYPDFFCFAS